MDGKSLDILSDTLSKLKELAPGIFTEDQIDWEKLQATLGNQINLSQERYHLNWAGKSEVFRILQQRTSATLIPVPEESYPVQSSFCHSESSRQRGEESQNFFIEGENLEVLKVLQKSYFGKIKMIYIDPPYNTGSDSFIYPDRFAESKDEYLKRIGDKDEEGFLLKEGMFRKNSKDSGHYHSNWLSMMYPRLYLARNLLRDDGVIFVSIDDNEVHNLRMIMNEIFGEENFVANIVWKHTEQSKNDERFFSRHFNYILVYSKSNKVNGFRFPRTELDNKNYSNPDKDPKGDWRSGDVRSPHLRKTLRFNIATPSGKKIEPPEFGWRWSEDEIRKKIIAGEIIFDDDETKIIRKIYLKDQEGRTPENLWAGNSYGTTRSANAELKEIFEDAVPFDTPKPTSLIKRIMSLIYDEKDYFILDFFAGSGTTAQAVMELNKEAGGNRKFILVQLPEKTDEASEAYKAGYKTIADICKERIRRVIKKLNHGHSDPDSSGEESHKPDLFAGDSSSGKSLSQNELAGFNVFKLAPSNFKIWRSDVIENTEDLEKMMNIFDDQVKPNAEKENMLYELILKSGYPLTIDVKTRHASSLRDGYYSINNNETIILLEAINQTIVDEIIKLNPKNVISLDKLFAGNDQLKTNTVLQMKDANIEFRTV